MTHDFTDEELLELLELARLALANNDFFSHATEEMDLHANYLYQLHDKLVNFLDGDILERGI